MKTILAIASVSLLTTAACKKDEPSKKSGEPAGKVTDSGKPAPEQDTGPFAGWDLDGRRAAFQGALVTSGNGLGPIEAWEVTGDQVKVWNGTEEKTLAFAVESPCEASVTETSSDGSSSGVTSHFTLKDGAIVMGLGDAGSRRGNEAVVCMSNKVLVLDAKGTCTSWEKDMFGDKWKSEPGKCGFAKDGDKDVFKATVNDYESTLLVDGDTIWSEQLSRAHSEKAADFAAAKATRDAQK